MKNLFYIINNNKYVYFIYLLLVIIIYYQTKNFDFALDDDLIKENIEGKIFQISDLIEIFKERYNRVEYRPLVVLSFALEHLLFGELIPKYSHLFNVLLFYIIIISIYYVFNFITKYKYKLEVFWAIAFFCVHPLCTEVVANLKSRDGMLSMFFCVWSLYFFILADRKNQSKLYYTWSIILCIIGAFAKIDIYGMFIFVFLYFLSKANKQSILRGFVLLGIFILLTTLIRTTLINYLLPIEESKSTLAVTTFTENPIADLGGLFIKITAAIQTTIIYLIKIIFPLDLRYYYGYNYYNLETTISISIILKSLVLFFLIISIYFLSKKNKYIFLFFIGFFSFIFYALNYITSVAGIVADRYVFIALPWFFMMIFIILNSVHLSQKLISNIAFSIILIFFMFTSFSRTKVWKNSLSLIEADAPHLSQSFEGMRIAASIYYEEYKLNKDTTYLNKAINCALNANKVYPKNIIINTQLGQLYFNNGEMQKAKSYLLKATQADSTNATVYHYLGDAYYSEKNYNNAEKYYFKALQFAKENQKRIIINNISTLYFEQGLKDKTLQFNLDRIKNDSTFFAAYENLGYFYQSENNSELSKKYFDKAVQLGMPTDELPN